MLGRQLGALKLGLNLIALAPGKRAFAFHSHRVNEEMFYVVAGRGEMRLGENRHALHAGNVVACPAGGPETAHQIINTGDEELRYLADQHTGVARGVRLPRFGQVRGDDGRRGRVRRDGTAWGIAGLLGR
jgi:uncharacterized cupin superfamily protein